MMEEATVTGNHDRDYRLLEPPSGRHGAGADPGRRVEDREKALGLEATWSPSTPGQVPGTKR